MSFGVFWVPSHNLLMDLDTVFSHGIRIAIEILFNDHNHDLTSDTHWRGVFL